MKTPNVTIRRSMTTRGFKRRLLRALDVAQARIERKGVPYTRAYLWLYAAASQLSLTVGADGTFTAHDQHDTDLTREACAVVGWPV